MKTDNKAQFLARMDAKERDQRFATDQRLFSQSFDIDRVMWVASLLLVRYKQCV